MGWDREAGDSPAITARTSAAITLTLARRLHRTGQLRRKERTRWVMCQLTTEAPDRKSIAIAEQMAPAPRPNGGALS
jgi:hypothetical protein